MPIPKGPEGLREQNAVSVTREGSHYVYSFTKRPDYQHLKALTEGLRKILSEGMVNNDSGLGFAEKEIDPSYLQPGQKSTDLVLKINANVPVETVQRVFEYLNTDGFARFELTTENYPEGNYSEAGSIRDAISKAERRVL